MTPIATFPLMRNDHLSIPFKVHVSGDGTRLAVLNTYGMPYAQQLLVIDTRDHTVVGRWQFDETRNRLFNLDVQLNHDGTTAVLVGGILPDGAGETYAPECMLTRLTVDSGEMQQVPVGPVGFSFVSVAPSGNTAYVVYNGNAEDPVHHYQLFAVDLTTLEIIATHTLDAPVNNILYRPAEGRGVMSVGRNVVALDLHDHTVGETLAPRFNHPYLLASFDPEEAEIYAAYVASSVVVKVLDVNRREVVDQHSFTWDWTASTNIVCYGPDHLIFPPSSSAGAICLWNRRTGEIDHQAGLPGNLILSTPHPDGKHFYLFDYQDQTLKLVASAPLFASAAAIRAAAG